MVSKRIGSVMYEIITDGHRPHRRHANQMRARTSSGRGHLAGDSTKHQLPLDILAEVAPTPWAPTPKAPIPVERNNDPSSTSQHEHPRETGYTNRITARDQTITKVLFHSSFITAILYGIIPYFMMAYNWFQGQYPLVKLLPFKVVLPYDSQDPTLFILTTIFLNYASVPTITAMTSTDALFSGVCLYMDGQFQAIRLELEALAETVDKYTLKSSAAETLRINLELRRINKRHQTIIDVVSEVRHAFTPTILIMHICAAFMICVISMAMFLAEGINKLTYMPYTFTVLMLLFMYSYGGTIVRDSSEAIQTVAYGFPWYRFDRNTRHLVQMMMVRAKYGCNVDVPFFQTSMATFSVIVRSAMSYITLMKSFL
ncbi:odorant receptor 22c-like [Anopheles arabiensis]|uniref:odorant receptor 22c-like n=1 Tax=Anopheles arabiensis TaxID=7173 RepID=UPI001AACD775|nr:odorant receptor 22c-like [Anopheles arabiensis]